MAKIKVKNLAQLENAVKGLIHDEMFFSSNLQDTIAEVMHEKVKTNVYDAYDPIHYKRRGNNDGLLDMDNMEFTDVDVQGNGVKFTFENTAKTNGSGVLADKDLAPLIENGVEDSNKPWEQPRPFTEETAQNLQENKGELYDALRKDLKNLGLKVR